MSVSVGMISGLATAAGGIALVVLSRLFRSRPDLQELFGARQPDKSPAAQERTDRNLELIGWALALGGVTMALTL